ncbi:GmrSD restriction endonuclease domain-containing protein [Bacillus paranthracis]|uniref:GmrSD restriction endonuclease domain-containing protein n=1 Tax=Bacillus TaxID=1386 RepID=UPI0002790B78|nr:MULTISPECIES: DUF262 domain-containing protein [Bacillus]EJP99108.1 hypothetical protein IC5_04770 [Bacillus cereus AND1407]KFL84884.1 hypothetical protein DJ51_3783 [Bacillus cereus]MRA60889.1 DUF262 domain-containing protein [Bacillus thuringiensis]OUC01128.1 DUF262 domain-containing protein [Bacillus thuringiensis serovar canadensis]KAB7639506.1 DUF262 domain-containing protein [Bacillus sp. B4-WWTP-NA-D-NA-NA]
MKEKEYSIRDIFTGNYKIPIYQRAYAWSDREIETLVDDIYDYSLGTNQNYYIGSLVVHKDHEDKENVIDGQQRLTTLSLLICYLKNESKYKDLVQDINVNLEFESRKRSTDIFKYLKKNYEKVIDESNELVNGYRILKKKLKNGKYDERYFQYLIENVILIKNNLPKDTDLNHYFEIMNNRGEQLEKHEIVKAHLIGKLDVSDEIGRKVISEVWNACQQLDKYVQIGFKTVIRGKVFGRGWDEFIPKDYSSMKKMFEEENKNSSSFLGSITIDKIIQSSDSAKRKSEKSQTDDDTGRYHSIINFPNFLLHVLKLFKGDSFDWSNGSEVVSLDDKKLINQFKVNIKTVGDVESFVYMLLKTRYVFDNYVIKTDHMNDATEDDSNWSLHKPYLVKSKNGNKLSPRNTFGDKNTQEIVVKIESMFQVTDPRQIYKTFLFGILRILNTWIDSKDEKQLVDHLITFAKERFQVLINDEGVYDSGVNTPNYIFNFLDFVLWYRQVIEQKKDFEVKVSDFEFKYRNSVEHFYPQNPNQAENHKRLEDEHLNNFGNLCIMARRHNSLRSNLMPSAKIKEFSSTSQSLKFMLMEKITNKNSAWNEKEIIQHGADMKKLLSEFIS